MNSAGQSTFPTHAAVVSLPPARPLSLHPIFPRSTLPPRITIAPGRVSILPRLPPRPTLPPGVRAKRMMVSVRCAAARLVRRLPRHVDVEDLVGAGSLGLADAFSRRGSMPGSEFEAFAACRIRGAMLDELRRLDAMPRRSRRSAKRLAKASHAVEQKLGRPAVEEEVAAELGLEVAAYQALRAKIDASRAPLPFSALGSDDEDASQEVADPTDAAPDTLTARAQVSALLMARIGALPERVRTVLIGIYVEGTTLKQIGLALGVSESRVCQIHTEALAALRSTFASGEDGEESYAVGDEPAPRSQVRVKSAVRAQGGAARSRTSRA